MSKVDVDMDGVDDSGEAPPREVIRNGVYLYDIFFVSDSKPTAKGDPMWKIRLEVVEGDDKGAWVFDQLVFNKGGLPRVKMLYKQLGLPCEGQLQLDPSDILHMKVYANTVVTEYDKKMKNEITYDGYHHKYAPAEAPALTTVAAAMPPTTPPTDDDLPF